ncbi:MAG: 1-deoxy-D-xylulose-5-phosphate synthase [Candidatus Moranbacteria bacterium]|jgi:1-deoxy-D-xylulose-5-phosphate synthase|nr:1-deoxy-D-xylulose-5-phosphate synthase [Candidatus Moranbacteria bacterium]
MDKKSKKILDNVDFPSDVRKLSAGKLPRLCRELRDFLIESVAQSGGHFGSNLGVVELTVALHRVFDTPRDLLIWDVGHQAYPHKILTGRKDKMNTIRKYGGLAPFPKREESEYDVFGVGHSSTSISAALGMALANKNKKNPPQVVAVIGDGALGGGMAFEALNHAGDAGADILVVLNDNKMSISPNVGGMGKYLTRLISSPSYINFREQGRKILDTVPAIGKFARRVESHGKGLVTPGTFFEELGFEYYGPIDGHDVGELVEVLSNLKKIKGPKILHIITKKGKGYARAEDDEFSLHAVKPFDPVTGKKNGGDVKNISYTDVFSQWLCGKAKKDNKLHAITPAMCSGSGLADFCKMFPSRYHDVGIAEQHAVTLAAGLACQGKKPVVSIYSSFLQRAFDQVIHDVALQNMDVLFAIDRAGIVGADGATHNGSFDLSYLRMIPGMVIMAPSDKNECYSMLESGYKYSGPVAVRYPRGGGEDKFSPKKVEVMEIGKAKIERKGKELAILSFGALTRNCLKAARDRGATLVNMRFVKPLDEELLKKLAKTHKYFVTIEDNTIVGGAGSAVNEFVVNNGLDVKVKNLGLPDKFLQHGTREEILAEAGLDEEGISKSIYFFKKVNK